MKWSTDTDVEVVVDTDCCFGCFKRGFTGSAGTAGGVEAVMVLTLIVLKWRALSTRFYSWISKSES